MVSVGSRTVDMSPRLRAVVEVAPPRSGSACRLSADKRQPDTHRDASYSSGTIPRQVVASVELHRGEDVGASATEPAIRSPERSSVIHFDETGVCPEGGPCHSTCGPPNDVGAAIDVPDSHDSHVPNREEVDLERVGHVGGSPRCADSDHLLDGSVDGDRAESERSRHELGSHRRQGGA